MNVRAKPLQFQHNRAAGAVSEEECEVRQVNRVDVSLAKIILAAGNWCRENIKERREDSTIEQRPIARHKPGAHKAQILRTGSGQAYLWIPRVALDHCDVAAEVDGKAAYAAKIFGSPAETVGGSGRYRVT